MAEHDTESMIKFAGMGKPAKFGDAFGDIDPTGEQGDGAEEGGNKNSIPEVEDEKMELTPEEEKELDAE